MLTLSPLREDRLHQQNRLVLTIYLFLEEQSVKHFTYCRKANLLRHFTFIVKAELLTVYSL